MSSQVFVQYLAVPIVLTERNSSLITVFSQIIRKYSTDKKLERTKQEESKNIFCLPFIGFFTQSSQYQIWQANTYAILTNGNRTWTASVGIFN